MRESVIFMLHSTSVSVIDLFVFGHNSWNATNMHCQIMWLAHDCWCPRLLVPTIDLIKYSSVFDHQHGGRGVTGKPSIQSNFLCFYNQTSPSCWLKNKKIKYVYDKELSQIFALWQEARNQTSFLKGNTELRQRLQVCMIRYVGMCRREIWSCCLNGIYSTNS